MDSKTLDKFIDDIVSKHNVDKTSLLNEIYDWLKLKYGTVFLEKERGIIDTLKDKIITRLYNFDNHSLNIKTADIAASYKADHIETSYIAQAEHELEAEGLINKNGDTLSLTQAGILKYKAFYGELG